MKFARTQFKLFAIVMIAGLSMGNEGCEKGSTARVLKLDAEVGKVTAQPVKLPTGEVLNFPYVTNTLFYRSVMNSDHFVMMNPVPSPGVASEASVQAKAADSEELSLDEQVLSKYNFLAQVRDGVESKSLSSKVEAQVSGSTLPVCLYDLPQSLLKGEVISFEANWGVGVGIGYGSDGAQKLPGNVKGKVKFKQSRLDMGLRSEDPLNHLVLAQAIGVSHQSDIDLTVDFTVGIPIGLDFFFKTPLATVVTKAFDKGLVKMIADYIKMRSNRGSWDDVWESRVLYNPDIVDNETYIAFRGGYRYGMHKGDTFTVTNMYYKWEADPCTSALKYKIGRTPTPVAEVQVVEVGDNVAVAKVTKYMIEQRIEPGAQIRVLKLMAPETAKK